MPRILIVATPGNGDSGLLPWCVTARRGAGCDGRRDPDNRLEPRRDEHRSDHHVSMLPAMQVASTPAIPTTVIALPVMLLFFAITASISSQLASLESAAIAAAEYATMLTGSAVLNDAAGDCPMPWRASRRRSAGFARLVTSRPAAGSRSWPSP
jgi:hypothetical protein